MTPHAKYLTLCTLLMWSAIQFLASADVPSTEEIVKYCNSTFNNRRGICISFEKKLKNCHPLLKLLRERKFAELQQTFCDEPEQGDSFELSWVCCPEDELVDISHEDFGSHPNFNLLPHPENSVCGQSGNSDRIVGGEDAGAGDFPWMARLAVKRDDEDTEEFVCGGSIINERYVLGAAHCFKDNVKLTKIRVGDTHDDVEKECIEYGDSTICEMEEDYGVEDIIIHRDYSGITGSQHDIALIRLNRDIRNISSLFVRPICLPFTKEFNIPPLQITTPGQTGSNVQAIVAGWGKLYNSDSIGSPDLQFLSVPVTDTVQCGKSFKANNVTVTELQVCAGGEKGKGSCAGDSGSPLFYPAKTKGKATIRNFQIGIVSFGKHQCAAGNAPVVYTRVKRYLTWILDHIK